MSEPAFKRQRIEYARDDSINQQHSQPINHANVPSTDPIATQSSVGLNHLNAGELKVLGQYLHFDEKLLKLTRLNQSIRQSIKVDALFRYDTLNISPNLYDAICQSPDPSAHASMFRLMDIVQGITLSIKTEEPEPKPPIEQSEAERSNSQPDNETDAQSVKQASKQTNEDYNPAAGCVNHYRGVGMR